MSEKRRETSRERQRQETESESEAETVVCVCEERWGTDVKDVEEGSVFADSEWRGKEAGVPVSSDRRQCAHIYLSHCPPPRPNGVANLHNGIPACIHA